MRRHAAVLAEQRRRYRRPAVQAAPGDHEQRERRPDRAERAHASERGDAAGFSADDRLRRRSSGSWLRGRLSSHHRRGLAECTCADGRAAGDDRLPPRLCDAGGRRAQRCDLARHRRDGRLRLGLAAAQQQHQLRSDGHRRALAQRCGDRARELCGRFVGIAPMERVVQRARTTDLSRDADRRARAARRVGFATRPADCGRRLSAAPARSASARRPTPTACARSCSA